jgi:hypothetical protein
VCCREGPESPELPLHEPPSCLPRVVPGEIKVLPSDGREMAKRLVVDLNAMFPQGRNRGQLKKRNITYVKVFQESSD